jgi:Cd2+/Zn2+-exporting ATPase
VTKGIGDKVFSGTLNLEGYFDVEVTADASHSVVARIAELVRTAEARRAPIEHAVARFARVYTPVVTLLALLVVVVPPVLGLGDTLEWFVRGVTLLVIACPCALVIATPVTVVSALTRLASLGILVKGGALLGALAHTKVFAFDKTGTLTYGRPTVTATRARDCRHDDAASPECEPCDELVALAASVERGSSHPLAQAVLDAAADRRLQHRYDAATDIRAHAGRGVTGTLDGRRLTVGHEGLFAASPELDAFLVCTFKFSTNTIGAMHHLFLL